MKKAIFIIGFSISMFFLFQACKKEVAAAGTTNADYLAKTDCTGSTPTYAKNIKTIFDTKCATSGCHSEVAAAHGLDLSSYEKSKNLFNVHAMLCSINQDSGCDKMPQGSAKLPDADIKTITCWAKNGFAQ
jgi:hypothetical protein